MTTDTQKRLGDILIESVLVSKDELEQALRRQEQTGEPLGKAIINLGYLSEYELLEALSKQLDVPYLTLNNYMLKPEIAKLIPEEMARKYMTIPLFKIENTLTVGINDPTNIMALDEISRETGHEVEPVLCSDKEIKEALDEVYGVVASMDKTMEEYQQASSNGEAEDESTEGEIPIINIVNLIFKRALKARASDIHLNPEEDQLRVRFRIDGVLEEIWNQPKRFQDAIISRIKVMAGLDIAEKRRPQDGRFKMTIEDRDIDFRVSTLPTVNGENAVLRLLDPTSVSVQLSQLGLNSKLEDKLRRLIAVPYGVLLVTGPTRSRKTG